MKSQREFNNIMDSLDNKKQWHVFWWLITFQKRKCKILYDCIDEGMSANSAYEKAIELLKPTDHANDR